MILDSTLLFSDEQAITATAPSTNHIDLGATGTPYGGSARVRDIGPGTNIPWFVTVTASFNTLTSLAIELQVDDNDSFSSATTVASASYLLAQLTAGTMLDFPDYVPQGTDERYFRLRYVVTGSNPSTGKLTAGIVAAKQTNTGAHYGG